MPDMEANLPTSRYKSLPDEVSLSLGRAPRGSVPPEADLTLLSNQTRTQDGIPWSYHIEDAPDR